MARSVRIAVFGLVAAGLIALAILLGDGRSGVVPLQRARPITSATVPVPEVIGAAGRRKAALERTASRFLRAFLRFEVGDVAASVERSIRRLSTPDFARYLAAAPRSRSRRPHPAARLVTVEISFVDRDADRALVRAVARRPDGPEELAFVFSLRAGRWLAEGAAE